MNHGEKIERGRPLVALLFLAAACLLVLSVAVTYWIGLLALEDTRKLAAQRSVMQQLNEFLSTLMDAETGQRGYLLTGDAKYREPYDKAMAKIPAQLDALRDLASRGDLREEQVSQIVDLTEQRLSLIAESIEARRDNGPEAALAIVKSDRGRQMMEEIRSSIAEIDAEKEAGFAARARRATILGTTVFTLTVVLNLAFLAWVYRRVTGEIVRREAAALETRRQRELLATTLKSIGDAVIATDIAGRITLVNGVAQSLTGWAEAEALGRPLNDVFHIINEETRQAAEDPVAKVLQSGRVVGLANHTALLSKDGTERSIGDSGSPICDEHGRVIGVVLVFRDVTQEKRAEEALANQASFPRLNPCPIVEADLTGQVHFLNPAAEGLFPELKQSGREHPWLADWEAVVRTLLEGTKRTYVREVIVGEHCYQQSLYYVEGIRRIRTYGVDISEKKRAEEGILRAKEEWERTFDSVPDAIALLDEHHRILRVNRAMAQRLGCQAEECVGQHCYRGVHGTDCPPAFCPHVLTLTDGQEHTAEVHEERLGGDFLVTTTPLRDAQGRMCGAVHIARDITQQKRAAEELRISEERRKVAEAVQAERQRLNDVLNMLPVYVVLLSPDYRVPFANRFFEERFGKSDGQRCYEYLFQRTEPCEVCETFKILKTNAPLRWEWTGPDGHNYDIYDFPFTDADGSPLIMEVGVDVTETKRAEAELHKYRQHLEELVARRTEELARSNKDLEQFAYVASHDLQEPLRMITGYVQLLAERYRGQIDEKADKYIHYAVDGAERMAGLIRDLLAYSRVNTSGEQICQTAVADAFELAMKNVQSAIRESGAVVTHDSLAEVRAYRTQLAQLFQNLIANAIKFRAPDRPPCIHVSVRQEQGHWLFSVQDNGIGFEQQYAERIFLIFQRLHGRGQYPGTGIGLAICKRIVERHGGKIWATSEPDKGSTFFFTLPQ